MEMSLPVLIIGRSGSGKTYSLKNCNPENFGILSVEKGRLPFKTSLKVTRVPEFKDKDHSPAQSAVARYTWITNVFRNCKTKSVVIDDSQYLLASEFFDRAMEKGYDKYTAMGSNFRDLIHNINANPDDDKIVYFLHHSELADDGREKVKTIGKMLDEKLCVEGCFDVVIYCQDQIFYTQANGQSVAKSPDGMFPLEMPNDLTAVDAAIREYYDMASNKPTEKKQEDK